MKIFTPVGLELTAVKGKVIRSRKP
jgi:hypothetical protein